MGNDAGIAHRRAFDGVLAGESGAEQQLTGVGKRPSRTDAAAQLGRVAMERLDEIAMTTHEARDDVVEGSLNLILVQGQEALHNGCGARVLVVEAFLPGHEQPGDDPRMICGQADGAPTDGCCDRRRHCGAMARCRACCSVESSASVDSAP